MRRACVLCSSSAYAPILSIRLRTVHGMIAESAEKMRPDADPTTFFAGPLAHSLAR